MLSSLLEVITVNLGDGFVLIAYCSSSGMIKMISPKIPKSR